MVGVGLNLHRDHIRRLPYWLVWGLTSTETTYGGCPIDWCGAEPLQRPHTAAARLIGVGLNLYKDYIQRLPDWLVWDLTSTETTYGGCPIGVGLNLYKDHIQRLPDWLVWNLTSTDHIQRLPDWLVTGTGFLLSCLRRDPGGDAIPGQEMGRLPHATLPPLE